MISSLELSEMRFHAFHGISEQEKKVGNTYIVDLKLYLDLSKASESDLLEDTINYANIFLIVKKEMEISSNLIEHVAGRIIKTIKKAYPEILTIEVKVSKISPPISGQIRSASVLLKN